jgi:hypothetical protein
MSFPLTNRLLEKSFESVVNASCTSKVENMKLFWNRKIKLDYIRKMEKKIEMEQCYVTPERVNKYLKSKKTNFQVNFDDDSCFHLIGWHSFKDKWKIPFDKNSTTKRLFDNRIEVDMMFSDSLLQYFQDSSKTIVIKQMQYHSMIIVMPQEDNFDFSNFDKQKYSIIDKSPILKERCVDFYLPKFKKENTINYTGKFDLSKMTDYPDLVTIIQKNLIEIDEDGVRVESIMELNSVDSCSRNKIIVIDKPFFIFIKNKHGQIVIDGVVNF